MKNKRFTAFALAVCITASSLLIGCSDKEGDVMRNNITVTTSAAIAAADSLMQKLPDLSQKVVLGTAETADSYGVDLSDFESDGYVIKAQDDSILLFGKSADGLTAATNKFVNQYNSGAVEDVAFHEGYRIEKLEIFGIDIAEYVIEYPAENNENMLFAVSELQQLVKKACGAELVSHVGDSGAEHVIEFRFSDDAALKDEGYRYFEENGTLVLEGARARGCMNAVYRFLQNECGWDRLIAGESNLKESDYINIPLGISKTETPAFEYFYIHDQVWKDSKFTTDRNLPNAAQNTSATITHACHGIIKFLDDPSNGWQDQPCFTSEETYEMVRDRVEAYIQDEISKGKTPGVDLIEIDIAQTDSRKYHTCKECRDVFAEEGSHSGAVVRFANRLSEEMNEKYPGIVYKIFAYAGSNKPCKTAPNEHVYVTYCFDCCCSNHPIDGSECAEGAKNFSNQKYTDFGEWFEGWCDLADNLYVWFYSLDTNFHDYAVIDTIYDDFTYLAENNVKGVFWQSTNHGLGMKRIDHQLAYELNWNIDMTKEEYMELYHELMAEEYGAGYGYVEKCIDVMNEAQNEAGCWTCWGWDYPRLYSSVSVYYDTAFYGKNYDYIIDVMDMAIAMAETPDQIKHTEMLMISALYKGCYSLYFKAYEADDTEQIAILSERFDRAMELMRKYGFNLNGDVGVYDTIDGFVCNFQYKSLEDAAWLDWVTCREDLCPGFEKPVPGKYR